MSTEFQPSWPTSRVGHEVYERGVSAVLSEIADTLDKFLITTPEGREPCDQSWIGFNDRLKALANEAKGIEASTKEIP